MKSKVDYSRDYLIELCQRSVVHHSKWNDRDSFIAQRNVQSIYLGLTAGLEFIVEVDDTNSFLDIEFTHPIDHEKLLNGKHLEISTRKDYFRDCDPDYETEMFVGYGIDWHCDYTCTFMPTEQRLAEAGDGEDWY
jgi:hypothetical protein